MKNSELVHKWIYEGNEYSWTAHHYRVMYPYLFKFEILTGIEIIDVNIISIQRESLHILMTLIEELIVSFISLYKEPSFKVVKENESSFEKITFRDKEYLLEYRQTNPVGSIIYAMFCFTETLNQAIMNGKTIILTSE